MSMDIPLPLPNTPPSPPNAFGIARKSRIEICLKIRQGVGSWVRYFLACQGDLMWLHNSDWCWTNSNHLRITRDIVRASSWKEGWRDSMWEVLAASWYWCSCCHRYATPLFRLHQEFTWSDTLKFKTAVLALQRGLPSKICNRPNKGFTQTLIPQQLVCGKASMIQKFASHGPKRH